MQAHKIQIQQTFNKAKPTYAQNAIIQQAMQQTLLAILQKHCQTKNLGNVLELGCGNGILSQKFSQLFDFEYYLAVDLVDFSENFTKTSRHTTRKIIFLQTDFEDLTTIKKANPILKYDLILSNAAIQWGNQPSFLPQLNTMLKDNGFLAFSTFGKENCQELRKIADVGLEYLDLEDYAMILNPNFKILESFEIKSPLHFPNALAVFQHLKNTGVNSIKKGFRINKKFLKEYEKRFQNTLTYHPLYILAQKCKA